MSTVQRNNEATARNLRALFDEATEQVYGGNAEVCPLFSSLETDEKRYLDPELVGEGGMKRVYRTFDSVTDRYVAMAKLQTGKPKSFYDPFIREARLTSILNHPNIMSVYDIGVDEDAAPFFTMALKTGDSLEDVLMGVHQGDQAYEATYPISARLEIFLKVCDAIAYAHSKGVIHLDIKPRNIQLGRFGEVLVCDWGLGKIIGSVDEVFESDIFSTDWLADATLVGEIKGTPGYMAPEQIIDGQSKTEKTDIYSLGCLLYACLTCMHPSEGNQEEILRATTAGSITPPGERAPEMTVPEGLNAVVMKAMSLNQEDRYDSAHQLGREIRSYLEGFATEAEDASFLKSLQLLYRRNRRVCRVSLVFIALIVLLAATFITQLSRKTRLAMMAEGRATREKQHAESTLLLYQMEQKRVAAGDAERSVLRLQPKKTAEPWFYKDPVAGNAMRIAAWEGRNTAQPYVIHALASFYFIAQDFERAGRMLAKWPTPINVARDRISTIWEKYASYEKLQEGLLPADRLAELLQEEYISKDFAEEIVLYDAAVRRDMTGYGEVIEALLALWNNNLENSTFHFAPETATLTLTGPDYKTLGADTALQEQKCLLAPLAVRKLDIRNTNLHDLAELRGMDNLEELDIRNTLVTDLSPLNQLTALRKVIISRKQLPKKIVNQLNDSVTVQVR